MGKGSDAPPAPDFGPLIADIEEWTKNLEDKAEELQLWFDTEYQDLQQKGDDIFNLQFQGAEDLMAWAQADRQLYDEYYAPLARQYAEDVAAWDSPEELTRVRGEAIADVSTAFSAARESAQRQLEGYGVDPSATRSQALDVGMRTQEALGKAFGANTAGREREMEATMLRGGAVQNIGMPMAGMAAGQAGQAAGVGAQALAGQGGIFGTGIQGQGLPLQAYGMAGQGYGMIGDIQNQAYANQLAAWQAENQGSDPFAQMLGLGASLFLGGAKPDIFAMPWWLGQDGGVVEQPKGYADGGRVEGTEQGMFTGDADGDERHDRIPALLTENEYVVPADVVKRKGTEFFDKLVQSTRGVKDTGGKASSGGYADGGPAQLPAGQALPALPGPVAPLPPRVQTGTRSVPSPALPAGQSPTVAPTARHEIDAALLTLLQKYGTAPMNAGALPVRAS